MTSVLAIEGLTKRYGGRDVVSDLRLTVEPGQVYGLLGPNGSGKTTTLGMVLGVIRPSRGQYRWFGQKPSGQSRRRVGALLEQPNFCPWLSAEENLKIIAAIRRVPRATSLISQVLQQVKLGGVGKQPVRGLSLGMKQRLALAAVLLGSPEVLVLDEPTNGVDASGIAEIRETIQQIGAAGKTILIASHILDELEKVCSHIAVLDQGRVIEQGPLAEVLAQGEAIEVAADNNDALAQALAELKLHPERGLALQTVSRDGTYFRITAQGSLSPADLNQYLFSKGVTASHLIQRKRSLEAHFLELIDKKKNA